MTAMPVRTGVGAAVSAADRAGPAAAGAGHVLARVPPRPRRDGRADHPGRADLRRARRAAAGQLQRAVGGVLANYPVNAGPGWHYPLGTDADGRSVLTLLIWGSRISLLIGFTATLLSMVIGALIGIVSGHFGKIIDNVLMRVTDWFLVVPFLPLAIVLAKTLGPSLGVIIFVIGVTSWPGTARIIRAQALAVETRPYLERARALGAGHWHQMIKHVLPNVMPLLLANTILTVAGDDPGRDHAVVPGPGRPAAAVLGPDAERGVLHRRRLDRQPAVAARARHRDHHRGAWRFTLVGHALESVLDPKLRER